MPPAPARHVAPAQAAHGGSLPWGSIPLLTAIYLTHRTTYISSATLSVETPLIDQIPGLSNGRDLLTRRDTVASFVVLLAGRSVREDVVRALPNETFGELLEGRPYLREATNFLRGLLGRRPSVLIPEQRAVAELQRRSAFQISDEAAGIFYIRANASAPKAAMDIVNTYIQVLMNRTRSGSQEQARKIREFLESQLQQAKASLGASEASLTSYQHQKGRVKLGSSTELDMARLSNAENALAEVQASQQVVAARAAALQKARDAAVRKLAQTAERQASRGGESTATDVTDDDRRLRSLKEAQQIVSQLEAKLESLRVRYTNAHPLLQVTQEDLLAARARVAQLARDLARSGARPEAADPVEIQRQLVALEADGVALNARAEIMREQVDRLRQKMGTLTQGELEFKNLLRAVESDRNLLTVLSERLMAARMREQSESGGFQIMDPASYPSEPSREQLWKHIFYALALAAGCAFAIPLGLERWRDPVETEPDVESLALPLLGSVATFSQNGGLQRHTNGRTSSIRPDATYPTPAQIHHEMWPKSPVRSSLGSVATFWRKGIANRPAHGRSSSTRPEATPPTPVQIDHEMYRAICATIETVWPKGQVRSILLTSPGPGEGKSTTAINLAYAFQEFGWRVLLIEADLRRPVLAHRLRLPMKATPDLVQFLQGSATFEQVCRPLPSGVTVIPSSVAPGNATILLASQGMRNLLTAARDRFDIILCDSAPVLAVPDNILLSKAFEAAIVVVKASATSKRQLAKTAKKLGLAEARILGVVLNHANTRDVDYYHHRHGRYYRYRRYYMNASPGTEGEPITKPPMTRR